MASPQSEVRGDVGGFHGPSLFIGSSSEGLEFARAARGLLNEDAEVTLWNEGFGRLGDTFIETLLNALPRFDFALLVMTPDDFLRTRHIEVFAPRDNVLFELGLFMGRLGRSRTFLLYQEDAVKLPTDLSGMIAATYKWPRDDQNHEGAVARACDLIRKAIRDLGVTEAKVGRNIQQLKSQQDRHEQELLRQQAQIRALQVSLTGLVTKFELIHLQKLDAGEPATVRYGDIMRDELNRLDAMEFIRPTNPRGLNALGEDHGGGLDDFDLKDYLEITQQGREYLALRAQLAERQVIG
jgi:hypothetical protein